MTFDPTITFGNILQLALWVVLAISAYHAIQTKFAVLEEMLRTHAAQLQQHAARLDRYEASIVDVVRELSRLVGRAEVEGKK